MTVGTSLGFDLDLTLIDTRHATEVAAIRINAAFGVQIDQWEFVSQIGLPIRRQLAKWVPDAQLDDAIAEFRATFLGPGAEYLVPTPAARDALEMAASRGPSVVITSRLLPVAKKMLAACHLKPNVVIGGLTGLEKAPAMRDANLTCYVGDHSLDMSGARAASVNGIGVLTGFHGRPELLEAGAAVVIRDLTELEGAYADLEKLGKPS